MMKEKKWISRVLAVVCAITVSISSMNLPILASTETPTETYTTVLGIEEFTGEAEKTYAGAVGTFVPLTAGNGALDGVQIKGIFNLSRYSSVLIGSQDKSRLMIGVNNNHILYYQFANARGVVSGTAETFDNSYASKDIQVEVGFTYTNKNESAGTADVVIELKLGDAIERKFTVTGVAVSELTRTVVVSPNSGTVTLKAKYGTILGIEDFTGEDEKTYTGAVGTFIPLTAGTGTLDGVQIKGILNLSRYSSVLIGSQDKSRLMIGVNNNSILYYQFANARGVVSGTAETFDNSYAGQDIEVEVGFTYTNKNEAAGTADVVIELKLGDAIERQFTVTGVAVSELARTVVVSPNSGTVTLKALPSSNPEEPQEPPTITYNTVLDIKDFTGEAEKTYTGAVGTFVPLTGGEGSLDSVQIKGILNLSRYSSVLIGSQDKNRLMIGVNNNHILYYQFANARGVVSGTAETFDNSYAGQDIEVEVGFTYTNKNEVAGTADVVIELKLGDAIERRFTVTGVAVSELTRTVVVSPNSGTVTLKAKYVAVFGIEDFTGEDEKTYTGAVGTFIPLTGGEGTLDKVQIKGIFNLSRYSSVLIGSQDKSRLMIGVNNNSILYYQFANARGVVSGTAETFDNSYAGQDIEVEVGFTYTNKDEVAGTADVVIELKLGDAIERKFMVTGVAVSELARTVVVSPNSGTVTLKAMPSSEPEGPQEPDEPQDPVEIVYDSTLSVKAFTQQDEVTYTSEIKPSAGDKSLDGVLIDGIYNFTGNAVIYVGAANWTGLRLELAGTDSIRYRFLGSADAHDTTVGPDKTGCDLWGEDVRIKLGFTFDDAKTTDTTTDVTIQVFIGEYQDTFTLTGVPKSALIGRMFVYPQQGSLTLKAVPGADDPDEPQKPQIPDGFAPTYDKVMKFTDFGITEDKTVTGGEEKPNGGDKLSLDGIMVEGTFSFSGIQSAAYIGSRGWGGLRFGGSRDGFTYQFMDHNGQGALHVTTISKEDTGCELFDSDVRIKAGFIIVSENEAKGTVNAIIEVQIGDTYQDVFAVNDIQKSNLIRGMHLYAAEGSSVTLKVDQSDLEYIDEPNDKKLSYDEEMTFFDFAITKDYVVENKQTRVRIANETLDGVSIEGTYFMTGNVILGFGGDWRGLQLQRTKTGMLYQYLDVDGKGAIYSKTITEEDTGCALYDKDLDIKVGFNFSNEDKATGIADVTIEVNIGPTYRDVFTVKGVRTANLQKWMLLYAADGDSGLTGSKLILRKPYMEPFKFEEFGFTKNWKVELKLK